MRVHIAILFCFLVHHSNGQQVDTTLDNVVNEGHEPSATNNHSFREIDNGISFQETTQKKFIGKDNVVFTTTNLVLSPVENEIFEQEITERKAMFDRDQKTLKRVWLRDFSLDGLTNGIMPTHSGLPFYASLIRMIEKFNSVGDLAFTSGFEQARMLKPDGEPGEEYKREFFHTWNLENGLWKLSIKTYKATD